VFTGIAPQIHLRHLSLVYLLLCVVLFSNCKTENNKPQTNESYREVLDDLNRRIKIPQRIERAVSLAPNLTEIVFAVGAGDKLVGVTSYCNFPSEAQKIQKIGDTLSPNIENIIALKPQIVLVSTASQMENFAKTLEQQNIAVFVTNPNSLDDIYKSINQIGEIFNQNENAKQVVDQLKERVAKIEAKTNAAKDTKVFVQIDKNSLYTVGRESFITDLITRAGGVSVTESVAAAYPNISKETAFGLNPEAIILSESPDNDAPSEVFKNSPAVKNGKVFKINADILSRPAPRIVDALEQISRALHPELFE
jgi:iron complex transport system substrate-binding protein